MSFYELMDERETHWQDDDEHVTPVPWGDYCADDDMAGMYLRAEEAWPNGQSLSQGLAGRTDAWSCPLDDDDLATAFDD